MKRVLNQLKAIFRTALKGFQTHIKEKNQTGPSLSFFYYRSLIELAQLYLSHDKKLNQAIYLIKSLINDFSNNDHLFATFFKNKDPYPPLLEESEYTLARIYIKMGEDSMAEECFASMLAHYNESKIK